MNKSNRFLALVVAALALTWAGAAMADYNVTVSNAANANGFWSGNVWSPSGSGANVCTADIEERLNSGNDVVIRTTGAGTENGDILVSDAVSWTTNQILTLNAQRHVAINAHITATGTKAGMVISTGAGGSGGGGGGCFISAAGTSFSFAGYVGLMLCVLIGFVGAERRKRMKTEGQRMKKGKK